MIHSNELIANRIKAKQEYKTEARLCQCNGEEPPESPEYLEWRYCGGLGMDVDHHQKYLIETEIKEILQ